MAISGANKATVNATSAPQTSSSYTPAANNGYLAAVRVTGTGLAITSADLTLTDTTGLAWVFVKASGTSTNALYVYRAQKPSGLSAGTLQVADAGSHSITKLAFSVDEFTGVDTTGTDGSGFTGVQTVQEGHGSGSTSGSISPALSAITSPDGVYNALSVAAALTITQPTGWPAAVNHSAANSVTLDVEFQDASSTTNPNPSWTGSQAFREIAIEIKSGSAPPTHSMAVSGAGS